MALPGSLVGATAPVARRPGAGGAGLPANGRVATVVGKGAGAYGLSREAAALVLWTLAVFLGLALASYRGDPSGSTGVPTPPGSDWVGVVGAGCARALVSAVGCIAWGLPVEMALVGIPLVRGRASPATPGRCAGDLLMAVVAAALIQVGVPPRTAFGTHPAAGVFRQVFGQLRLAAFSAAGSPLG